MARRRWGEWASARMLRALVREGARVHAAAGVRTVAPPVFFSARGWKRVSKKRVRGRGSCILRARFRALRVHLFLGQEPKADIFRGRTLTKRQQSPPGCTTRLFLGPK